MKQNNGYFPIFINLSGKKIVVIGGGTVARRRIETLLLFVDHLTVVAPKVVPELETLAEEGTISLLQTSYEREQILDADLVLACTDDPDVNHEIYSVCKCLGILVNVCNDRRMCDFYFPGIVKKEQVVVGITASGENHGKAKETRKKIEKLLEEKGDGCR